MKGGVEAIHKKLIVCFWNINGRKFLIKSEKIQNWLSKNFDVVFLSETHLVKEEKFKLNSFNEYHNAFSTHEDKKARGGVSCFIKNSLMDFIESVDVNFSDHILVRFNNGNIVFSSYIAPIDSPYFDPLNFSYLANAFVPVNNEAVVFGGGDMNGRVGNMVHIERTVMIHSTNTVKI